MELKLKIIEHNSNEFKEATFLRNAVLREPLGLKFTKIELQSEFSQIHFVGIINDKIIANLILVKSDNKRIKMRQVCIDPSFQRQGIGKKIVLFAEEWAVKNSFHFIYCHARKNALIFYKNLAYTISGKKFTEVDIEHYKLIKNLLT